MKTWIRGTVLAFILTALSASCAFAAQTPGCLDSVSGNTVSGWAVNSADPESGCEVRITVSNQVTKETVKDLTVKPSVHRADLTGEAMGDGNHGFEAIVDWSKLESGSYLIEAYVDEQKLSGALTYQNGAVEAFSSGQGGSMRSLGVFRTTAYCPCYGCSEGWGRQTCTGATAVASHTIAVDPRVIPFGSKVMINGVVYTAEDRGGAVKGNHIDIFFNTHGETRQYGTRNVEVFLLQ